MKQRMPHHKYLLRLLPVLMLALLLTGCTFGGKQRRVIAVSIQPQQFLLERLAGGHFEVVCLLGEGKNPEVYEPDMTSMMALERSDAYFMIGNIGFESAIVDKAKSNNAQLQVFNTSQGVETLLEGHGGGINEPDPHVWTSVRNLRIIARNMVNALCQLDAAHTQDYRQRFADLDRELEQLDRDFERALAPHQGDAFVVWHPSLSYFARDYGLKQVALEVEGKEASALTLKQKIDEAKASGAKLLFIQKEYDSHRAASVNQELGLRMVEINIMAADPAGEMRKIVEALADESK